MSDGEKREGAPEWPTIDEKWWLLAAIVCGALLIVAAIFAFWYVFSIEKPEDQVAFMRTISPFGTLIAGLITFCTVAWRGMVTTRQANEQKRQNDANENANYADLLERGAKLLGDKEIPQNRISGLALLNVVIREPQKRFAEQAMDILAHYFQERYFLEAEDPVLTPLRESMMIAARDHGVFSQRQGTFRADKMPEQDTRFFWPVIQGFKRMSFVGGHIREYELKKIAAINTAEDKAKSFLNLLPQTASVRFRNATIHGVKPPSGVYFSSCTFKSCDFSNSRLGEDMVQHDFQNCNFSGTCFEGAVWKQYFDGYISSTPDILYGNYFKDNAEPYIRDVDDWDEDQENHPIIPFDWNAALEHRLTNCSYLRPRPRRPRF